MKKLSVLALLLHAAVAAMATTNTYELSLAGVTSSLNIIFSGLLVVRPNSNAPWGTVCKNDATSPFTVSDAVVACRTMFPTNATIGVPMASSTAQRGIFDTATMYMSNVDCSDYRLNISFATIRFPQCNFVESTATTARHNCSARDAVLLTCTVATGASSTPTFVSISAGTTPTTASGSGSGSGSVTTSTAASSAFNSTWQVSLEVSTTSPSSSLQGGLLRVRPNSNASWGTVCADSGFSFFEASAACRSIYGSSYLGTARASTAAERVGYQDATMYMDKVRCTSTYTTQYLQQCSFVESTPTVKRHNCSAADAVTVICVRGVSVSGTTAHVFATPLGIILSTIVAVGIMLFMQS